jgi:indolepyruvate ferredoxin oxidoreductase beta subunit
MSTPRKLGSDPSAPITIAILAMGGQGGGVLVDWIVDLALHNGYLAQATSVAGVAQRTGATIYYIELYAQAHIAASGKSPVLAQMPVPGEVDIVIASELMEAGRAMQRGLVTTDRTTLITSSHRDYATLEKVNPGNGIADANAVLTAGVTHAKRFLHEDMQAIALAQRSVLSAALFGALAGAAELPFDDAAYEDTIRRAGIGVEASLRCFRAGLQATCQPVKHETVLDPMVTAPRPLPARAASAWVEPLRARIEKEFPVSCHAMLGEGLQRVMEFQDIAYGNEYLNRMHGLHRHSVANGGEQHAHLATLEAARWVAVAMAYDDVIRVADLKTRWQRTQRLREEVGATADEVVGSVEFFHPRIEEVYGLMPASWSQWIEASPLLKKCLRALIGDGKRLRSHTVLGHCVLHALASLRRFRRHSQRHAVETAHINQWLDTTYTLMAQDYLLAVEVIRCRRLVKGYSDTHARGSSKFDRLLQAAPGLLGQENAAAALVKLRQTIEAEAAVAKVP